MVLVVLVVTTSCLAAPNLGINAVEQSIMLVQSSRFSLLLLVARSRCQQSSAQYVKLSIHDEPLAMSIESQPFLLLCCGFNRGSYSCYLNPTPLSSSVRHIIGSNDLAILAVLEVAKRHALHRLGLRWADRTGVSDNNDVNVTRTTTTTITTTTTTTTSTPNNNTGIPFAVGFNKKLDPL